MVNPRSNRASVLSVLSVAVMTAVAASCGDSTGLEARSRVSLSVASPSASSAATAGTVSAADATFTALPIIRGNGHVLDLQHADLTLSDVRLDRRDGHDDEDTDSDGRHRNDAVFHNGPLTIAIPLDGGIVTLVDGNLPFGTYDELEADLEFLRLRGTYDGQPFDVTLAIDRELALKLRPPLVVDADGRNVTLNVDIAHCFRDASGTPIDPRRFSQDVALRNAVRDCVARALRAFEDHDRDADDEDSDSDSDSDNHDDDSDTDSDGNGNT